MREVRIDLFVEKAGNLKIAAEAAERMEHCQELFHHTLKQILRRDITSDVCATQLLAPVIWKILQNELFTVSKRDRGRTYDILKENKATIRKEADSITTGFVKKLFAAEGVDLTQPLKYTVASTISAVAEKLATDLKLFYVGSDTRSQTVVLAQQMPQKEADARTPLSPAKSIDQTQQIADILHALNSNSNKGRKRYRKSR